MQRQAGGGSGGAGRGQRHPDDGVAAEPALVGGAVELAKEGVEAALVGRVAAVSAGAMSSLTFRRAACTPKPRQAAPPSRSSTASLLPVERPAGTSARPITSPADDVDLQRRVAAAVEDHAGVDAGDRRAHEFAFPLVCCARRRRWRSAPESRGSARGAATGRSGATSGAAAGGRQASPRGREPGASARRVRRPGW